MTMPHTCVCATCRRELSPMFITGARADGEIVNPHVLADAQAPKPDFARMAQVLREHWLTGLECDHEAKTDVANCFCGRWRPAPEPSVGQAVERWVEHVMEQVRR